MLNFNMTVEFDEADLQRRRNEAREQAQFALDTQVLKDSNYFIPFREGFLRNSSILHSRIGKGHIEWREPYARRLYYNPQFNFSKDVNPNAQGLWFEAAKAAYLRRWEEIAGVPYRNFFNGGG
ncbi:minor capsid protein [Cytobacillus oceanisediminis]|uniref:minor capsid protein n=1 Tax=Cytobacillus oceanisediminis TaxID=665099 RepID=UPI001C23A60A|nr:minor capsid protein [Cytobacillus oceanisediminis]MBU8773187.1 minor capsid protein [Cytobacillus oceanisediminis]